MAKTASNSTIQPLTEWWDEMGVDIDSALVDTMLAQATKTNVAAQQSARNAPSPPQKRTRTPKNLVLEAQEISAECATIDEIKQALEAFSGSPLKTGAVKTVVCAGVANAPLMVIGEGPGADEDRLGEPFVGRAGQLLDKMLGAINHSRESNAFITNVNFWRPPNNRNPSSEEVAVCLPFVNRMIELVKPKLVVTAGGVPTSELLGKSGIMRLRGQVQDFQTPSGYAVPIIPILHPSYLLRRPQDKSRAWRDLLVIEDTLARL